MMRGIFTALLLAVLVLVFYLPAALPPARFVDQLRVEVELNAGVWGTERASRILDRALALHGETTGAVPALQALRETPLPSGIDTVVAQQMWQANERLFGAAYFKSMQSLFMLALHRAASLYEWPPLLVAFIVGAIFDGLMRRKVKSKEFIQHSAEMFGLHLALVVVTLCSALVVLFVPVTVHPYALAALPLVVGVLLRQAIAQFHARG